MSLMVSTGAEPKALSDLIKYHLDQSFCFETGVYKAASGSASEVALGTVLGLSGLLTIDSAANPGNTGNGTVSTPAALGAGAQAGVYSVEFIGANAFSVFDPSGNRLADGAPGSAYDNGQISFEITAGGTAFEAGDGFAVTVSKDASAAQLVPLDLAAVDGAQTPAAIASAVVTRPVGATARGLVLKRGPATVARNHLVFPSGATAGQKTAIEDQLATLGIQVRDAV